MTNVELMQLYVSMRTSQELVATKLRERNIDWRHLAEHGLEGMAVVTHHRQHNGTVNESREAVRAFLRS